MIFKTFRKTIDHLCDKIINVSSFIYLKIIQPTETLNETIETAIVMSYVNAVHCTRSMIHVIIDRQIVYMSVKQTSGSSWLHSSEMWIMLRLNKCKRWEEIILHTGYVNLATLNFGAFSFSDFSEIA